MASALDTLCSQSYGAKQHHMLGIHMQRAMLVPMIVSIPLAIILAITRFILIFLGQDPQISAEDGNYAQLMVPSLFAYGLSSLAEQVLANPKHGISNDVKLLIDNFNAYSCMLDYCILIQ